MSSRKKKIRGFKKDNLQSKVMKFKFQKDQEGLYIPICSMSFHTGIALRSWVCEKRQCRHYHKAYIGEKEYG